jgi:hypothetical protein
MTRTEVRQEWQRLLRISCKSTADERRLNQCQDRLEELDAESMTAPVRLPVRVQAEGRTA